MKKGIQSERGSTLVLLVMAIGIISLLGTSILGVTMMNYKIKKANTEMKSSFYMSETGLDEAYERAYKLVLEAVNKGNEDAHDFINSVTEMVDQLNKESSVPTVLPVEFENFIWINPTTNMAEINETNKTNIKIEAEKKFSRRYEEFFTEDEIEKNLGLSSDNYRNGNIVKITHSEWEGPENDRELTVGISSTYTSDFSKTTSVDLVITIPDYSGPYVIKTETIARHHLWTKALSAVNVFVEGNHSSVAEDAFKVIGDAYIYDNLEIIGRNSGSTFDGTLVVNGENSSNRGILLKGVNASITSKDVYANNIIMSGTGASFKTLKDRKYGIYVKDDLEMNADGQTVDINGSYVGFSEGGESFEGNTKNSAIIINKFVGSSLNISESLTLYGTSYIEGTPYATGESISIPGNYIAYTQPLTGGYSGTQSLKWDNIDEIVYYEPLPPLVNKFKSESSKMQVWEKADYFQQYDVEYERYGLNLGGRKINVGNNPKTLGVAINGDIIEPTAYSVEFLAEIRGDGKGYKTTYESKTTNYYDSIEAKISENAQELLKGKELLYIGSDDIEIKDGKYNGNEVESGLIVTKGIVTIDGNFDFTGTIISGDDIIIKVGDGEKVSIKYNENYLAKLITENDLHRENKLFSDGTAGYFTITTYKNDNSTDVHFEDHINFKNWKSE